MGQQSPKVIIDQGGRVDGYHVLIMVYMFALNDEI